MPEISILGWFHTGIAIVALVTGIYSFIKFKQINPDHISGKTYLVCTFIAAATALMIFSRGAFGPAHGLAILTLGAIFVGTLAAKSSIFGKLSPYVQAISYSATFLFHMIPAITDGLMRLPVEAPIVTNIEDPLLRGFYLAFVLTYLVGATAQILWLRKSTAISS